MIQAWRSTSYLRRNENKDTGRDSIRGPERNGLAVTFSFEPLVLSVSQFRTTAVLCTTTVQYAKAYIYLLCSGVSFRSAALVYVYTGGGAQKESHGRVLRAEGNKEQRHLLVPGIWYLILCTRTFVGYQEFSERAAPARLVTTTIVTGSPARRAEAEKTQRSSVGDSYQICQPREASRGSP